MGGKLIKLVLMVVIFFVFFFGLLLGIFVKVVWVINFWVWRDKVIVKVCSIVVWLEFLLMVGCWLS